MAAINGTLYKITIGGTTINGLTNTSASFNVETRDVTTKDSSGNREILPTIFSGSYSGEIIVDLSDAYALEELYDALVAETEVTLVFTTATSGDVQWSQAAYLTSVEIEAPMEDNVTASFSAEGTGAVTKSDVA